MHKICFVDEHVDEINISDITNFEVYDVEGVKNNMDLFSDENVFGNTILLETNDNTNISPFIGGSSQGSSTYFCINLLTVFIKFKS